MTNCGVTGCEQPLHGMGRCTIHYHALQREAGNRRPLAPPVAVSSAGIWAEVQAERVRAHAKHGPQSMESMPADDPSGARRDIITEEVGEVAREFNEARHGNRPVDRALLRKELIQVAAMAAAWADALTPEPT